MSLFIGNLPRDADEKDLHDLFDKIGSCTFRFKVTTIYINLTYHRETTPLLIIRMRRMPTRPSRN